jgi:hypothetical protein
MLQLHMQNLHIPCAIDADTTTTDGRLAGSDRMKNKSHSRALASLALFTVLSTAVAQSPAEDMIALLGQRKKAPVTDIFKGAFKPATVFRGKTLTTWMIRFRDADPEFYESASEAFLAMGSNSVPFLVACNKLLDWEDEHLPSIQCLLDSMGEKSVAPLVKMLSSDYALEAWVSLGEVLGRHNLGMSYATKPMPKSDRKAARKWIQKVREERARNVKALLPCVASSDPFTRYAGLNLLQRVVGSTSKEDQARLTKGARKIMTTDRQDSVRGAACLLLGFASLEGVSGGLSAKEAQSMLEDVTLPESVRRAALMGMAFVKVRQSQPRSRPATPPVRQK